MPNSYVSDTQGTTSWTHFTIQTYLFVQYNLQVRDKVCNDETETYYAKIDCANRVQLYQGKEH